MYMILGIGIDVVSIPRIRAAAERFGDSFINRVFSKGEIDWCSQKQDPFPCYSARFAAKEAFVKALGTGFSRGITLRQIQVDRLDTDAPFLRLSKKARERLDRLGPTSVHLSLSHEKDTAVAVVVIERMESV